MKKIIVVLIIAAIILIPWQRLGKQIIPDKLDDLKNYENSLLKDALKVKDKRIMELEQELAEYNILYMELQLNYDEKVIESEIRKLGERVVYILQSNYKTNGTIKGWFKQSTRWTFNGTYETVALFDNSKIELREGILYVPSVEVQTPSLMNKADCFIVEDNLWARDVKWEELMLIQINADAEVKADLTEINEIVRKDLIQKYPEYEIQLKEEQT